MHPRCTTAAAASGGASRHARGPRIRPCARARLAPCCSRWCTRQDSNPQPGSYEELAPPIELRVRKVRGCSTRLSYGPIAITLIGPAGFEPAPPPLVRHQLVSSIGLDEWLRSTDLLRPRQARYQAALHPGELARRRSFDLRSALIDNQAATPAASRRMKINQPTAKPISP